MPPELIDRLFAKLAALYGSQKVAAMWANLNMAEVKACWADELRVYSVAQVGMALDYAKTVHRTFPPTLPEFLALCNQARADKPRGAQPAPAIADYSAPDLESAKARCLQTVATFKIGGRASPAWAYVARSRHDTGVVRQSPCTLDMIDEAIAADGGRNNPFKE